MRLILKTAYASLLCLFFSTNIYAQTTKEILQTLTPDETIQTVRILSNVDSSTVDGWNGDFILIYIKAQAKGIGSSVNNCKAKYEQQENTLIINLNPNLPEIFASGQTTPVTVKYEIFIPETLNIIEE